MRNISSIYQLGACYINASRAKTGLTPFRQSLVSAVLAYSIYVYTKLFYELCGSVGYLK